MKNVTLELLKNTYQNTRLVGTRQYHFRQQLEEQE